MSEPTHPSNPTNSELEHRPEADPPAPRAVPAFRPDAWEVPTQPYPQRPPVQVDPLISYYYGDWWTRSIGLVKSLWRPLATLQGIGVALSVLVQLPLLLALFGGSANGPRVQVDEAGTVEVTALFGRSPLLLFLVVVLTVLISSWSTLACMHLATRVAGGGPPNVAEAARGGLRRLANFTGWSILAGVVTVAGFFACILPGVYCVAVFLVLPAVVMFERSGAIGRCFTLFNRDLGTSLGRVATVFALIVGFGVVDQVVQRVFGVGEAVAPFSAVTGAATGIVSAGGYMAFDLLLSLVVGVLTAPMILTAYVDMRARSEPLTTAVLVAELEY